MMQFPVTFISQFFKISVNCLATGDINKEKLIVFEWSFYIYIKHFHLMSMIYRN